MTPDYIVLIRSRPSPEVATDLLNQLDQASRESRSIRIFFHGDGVEASMDFAPAWTKSSPDSEFCICRTSFERRMASNRPLPEWARMSTLVTFFQGVFAARRIDSIGIGGSLCCRPPANRAAGAASQHLLLEIGFAPADHRAGREALEMALGAASLELEASVLFHGPGLAHLAGEAARGWSQVTDYGLLEMYAEQSGDRSATTIPAEAVSVDQAAGLRARAATILIL